MTELRVGIAGSGFIARHFAISLDRQPDLELSLVLTRRDPVTVQGFPSRLVTNSAEDLLARSDVIVECSGDPVWATEIIEEAVDAKVPVVTMNTEFHITAGHSFVGRGLVTEAEGDQPGVLAALHEDAVACGFEPVVYGNMKGFLNPDPTPEEMAYWGERQGISLPMVTSFTDGTKVQAEQILVANHFGAGLIQEGMLGPDVVDLEEASEVLTKHYESSGRPVSDFVVSPSLPHGVFLVAKHDERQRAALEYLKMGPGPYYTIVRNNILVHLEISKSIRRLVHRHEILLDNSERPEFSLAAVAKRNLEPGTTIETAIGSWELRGHAVRIDDHPDHAPMGLIQSATLQHGVPKGGIVTLNDIEIPESRAATLWRNHKADR